MSQRITIRIHDKIATCLTETPVVCGNSDYVIDFEFDEEWNAHNVKTAVFKVNGEIVKRVFEGTVCEMPVFQNTLVAWVGVFAGTIDDGTLSTSTPALVRCKPCVTDGDTLPASPPDDVYNQIVELCNEALSTAASIEERANNGEFKGEKGDPTEVVHTTGQSTSSVMSQKAVTDEFDKRITIIDANELGDSAPTLRSLDTGLYLLSGIFRFNDIESGTFRILDESFFIVRKTANVTNVMCLNYDEMVYSSITDNSHSFNRFDHSTVDARIDAIDKKYVTKKYVDDEFVVRDEIRNQIIKYIENTDGGDVYLTDFESGVYYLKGSFLYTPAYGLSKVTLDNIATIDHIGDGSAIVIVYGEKSYTRYKISTYTNDIDEEYAEVDKSTINIFDLATKKSLEDYVTNKKLDEEMGDIDAALDSIIVIQNSLIGGESV